jgi:WD40 repeat protein
MTNTVKVWDAQTGQELFNFKIGPTSWRGLQSGRQTPGQCQVKVWDAQTGEELFTLKGHPAEINSVVFSPDGTRLASSARWINRVQVWDAQTSEELLNLKMGGYVNSLAFSPNGHWLVGDPDGTVTIWDAAPLPEKP